MLYKQLIPSMVEYYGKFKELDPLDFEIIEAMYKHGVRNISRLSKIINIPQQTLSYHIKKLDERRLVHFRALINEAKLGLKSYAVLASVPFNLTEVSSRALTCFPLWRYLALVDGWKRWCYVIYAVPPDKEIDLKEFLNELERRKIILDYDILPTTSSNYPLLNLNFYVQKKNTPVYDWNEWIRKYEAFPEEKLIEPIRYDRAEFDLYDLIILRCLEINARMKLREVVNEMAKILKEKNYQRFVPLVSRRLKQRIMPQGLIRGYRVYLFPNPGPTVLLLMYRLSFTNNSSLGKFVHGLRSFPFNIAYEKVLGKDELFIRFVIPVHECSNLRETIAELGEIGYLKDAHLLFGDLTRATWDNVALYQMYQGEAWNFSYGIALTMLEDVILKKKKCKGLNKDDKLV